jgi:hypothetical protein
MSPPVVELDREQVEKLLEETREGNKSAIESAERRQEEIAEEIEQSEKLVDSALRRLRRAKREIA